VEDIFAITSTAIDIFVSDINCNQLFITVRSMGNCLSTSGLFMVKPQQDGSVRSLIPTQLEGNKTRDETVLLFQPPLHELIPQVT
jgi:hypothetical protein